MILQLLWLFTSSVASSRLQTVSIRGNLRVEQLPISLTSSWSTWTFDDFGLTQVESDTSDNDQGLGWLNPTSFEELYMPSDIPLPTCRPALGIAVTNGLLRYAMPSLILTLQTPEKEWRNRGFATLPRARSWIDLFAFQTPAVQKLRFAAFGQVAPEVRFLEDQDGASAWNNLLREVDSLSVDAEFSRFKNLFQSDPSMDVLKDGFHFVDIPLDSQVQLKIPRYRFKAFLTDFESPQQLLEIEDPDVMNDEVGKICYGFQRYRYSRNENLAAKPCGELDVLCKIVGAARKSKFLPEAYRDLFEEGNIIR